MTPPIQHVVESLRTELRQRCGLLTLLEIQRVALHAFRRHRHSARQQIASVLRHPESYSDREIALFVPKESQPPLNALTTEVNRSVSELHTQANTTHETLRRALGNIRRLFATINPPDTTAPARRESTSIGADLNSVSLAIV